ncbi:MAG: phage portal protein [Treponema sp.]|nr:phage portal protein [Treponema sp.]
MVKLQWKKLEDTLMYYTQKVLDDVFDGDKFPGSFGYTRDYIINHGVDYFTLRRRCYQLFVENTYFQGLIKRVLRNEIHTGMYPEPTPIGSVLWPNLSEEEQEQEAAKYAEMINVYFTLYAGDQNVFDYKHRMTFGEFQEAVRQEAMICGDVVIVSRINQQTGLPSWDIISGNNIKTPFEYTVRKGNTITHGVERDAHGRHAAYWVEEFKNDNFQFTRIPVYGEKSGRRISWMVYGGSKLLNEVRGTPILASALYMLRDLDRYRDAELRAAVLGSIIPFFIEKSLPVQPSGGVLNSTVLNKNKGSEPDPVQDKPPRLDMVPGLVIDNLKPGESIKGFSPSHPNINFANFENVIISAICWGNLELPPEVGVLKFSTSYSASRQANTEFELYLKYRAFKNAKDVTQIVYEETIIQAALLGDLILPGFLEIIFNPKEWKTRAAWLKCEWAAMSRPSVDMSKEVKAYIDLEDSMDMTHEQVCRRFTGLSFKTVCLIRAREKKLMDRLGLHAKTDEDASGRPVDLIVQNTFEDDDEDQEEKQNDENENKED